MSSKSMICESVTTVNLFTVYTQRVIRDGIRGRGHALVYALPCW
jgi:hypothetical protein